LTRGVTISGKFVDEKGNDWQIGESHGLAHANLHQPSSVFDRWIFQNMYPPKDIEKTFSGFGGLSNFQSKYRPKGAEKSPEVHSALVKAVATRAR
jgi:hypothetical protein